MVLVLVLAKLLDGITTALVKRAFFRASNTVFADTLLRRVLRKFKSNTIRLSVCPALDCIECFCWRSWSMKSNYGRWNRCCRYGSHHTDKYGDQTVFF